MPKETKKSNWVVKYFKLIVSVNLDLIGMSSVFLGWTEFLDLIYAPIYGAAIFLLYRNPVWATIGLVEELAPYTDFIPSATIAWFDYYYGLPDIEDIKKHLD